MTPLLQGQESPLRPLADFPPTAVEIADFVQGMDADTYAERDAATRRVMALGVIAVPQLVDALHSPSGELRQRAQWLLCRQYTLEQLVPHLLPAAGRRGGTWARWTLRARLWQNFDELQELPHARRLFQFDGAGFDDYRDQTLVKFDEARTFAELERVVNPQVSLRSQVQQFSELGARLDALRIAHDHRHSTGYLIMELVARGVREGRADLVAFAESYVKALEELVAALATSSRSPAAACREASQRSDWSRGATDFMIDLLDPAAAHRRFLQERIGLTVEQLQQGYFEGLASPDSRRLSEGVGRVHLVDLYSEELQHWPTLPQDGVPQELLQRLAAVIRGGDKPKALAYLDALAGCRELADPTRKLDPSLAEELSQRLLQAADSADDFRAYFPARTMHDKFLQLWRLGVVPGTPQFPSDLFTSYLRGEPSAISESQRLALERFVRSRERGE